MDLMANKSDEVIDLTVSSFTLANHCALSDTVIEVLDTDESFLNTPNKPKSPSKKKKSKIPRKTSVKVQASKQVSKENEDKKIGDCSICYEPLGKKPLAATKCGHIFCMQCLQRSCKIVKKCPTCRSALKGTSAYHPLYV